MVYVQGFVAAVPSENREKYRAHAESAVPLFREFGCSRMVETWGDDVPRGKTTDFQGSVQATDDETVVFSWLEYPDKATYLSAIEKLMSDPRMETLGEMPFDGQRMIFGGFVPMVDEGPGGPMGYVDGYLVPVPAERKDDYRALAQSAAPIFLEHGATRIIEAWGDELTEGKRTDFHKAVKAERGEGVVFSYVEWPSKEARQAGWEKVMADERMKPPADTPFDGKRLIYGGFAPILDTDA